MRYISENSLVEDVELFAAQNLFLERYKKNALTKILYRLGLSAILKDINKSLIQKIKSFKPTVVLIFKGMEIFPETISLIKLLKIKVANYNPDNPFLFSGRGSGNKNISRSIDLYDLHLTYHRDVKEKIERTYSINTSLIPFGFDLSKQLYQECLLETEILKTCFLGNPDKFRAEAIVELAKNGIEIDVYGQNWNKFVNHNLINSFDSVYNDEFWKTIRRYRVQLNIMRPHNPTSHNMRTFEIPAVGGIQLAPDTIDHRIFFEPNLEINLYTDYANCSDQIRNILSWSADRAITMRNFARDRSVNSGYSYKDRSNEIVLQLYKLIDR